MATQMQLEVILAGNRMATRVLESRDNLRLNKGNGLTVPGAQFSM